MNLPLKVTKNIEIVDVLGSFFLIKENLMVLMQ